NTNINFEAFTVTLKDLTKTIGKAYASGQLAGVALTGGITSTITTAGTGTAMSALHGAAATNATMAALGGGTVASGGLGMAGGAIIAKGLVFAPALAFGGILLNSKAGEALEDARKYRDQVDKAVSNMDEASVYWVKLEKLLGIMNNNLKETHACLDGIYVKMYKTVCIDKHVDCATMSLDEKKLFWAGLTLAKICEAQLRKEFIKETSSDSVDVKNLVEEKDVLETSYRNPNIVKLPNGAQWPKIVEDII
ncbi:MAG: hypothetical protein HUJ63_07805, partial [Enterococcus sp.]|nr:hypothetical protein [Enterococcus sp.]